MGDGVLVYFGFPHAHDAERAVRAGLDLIQAVTGLSVPLQLDRTRPLSSDGAGYDLVMPERYFPPPWSVEELDS
jgi:hypothetical protein